MIDMYEYFGNLAGVIYKKMFALSQCLEFGTLDKNSVKTFSNTDSIGIQSVNMVMQSFKSQFFLFSASFEVTT